MFAKWTGGTLFFAMSCALALAGEVTPKTPSEAPAIAPARECNSCTLRHQALLKKKKQRERKAREAEEAAKTKLAD